MLPRAREFVMANLAAILAVLLVLAVLFGAVQSVRINGFGIWPLKVEGLASKAAKSDQLAKALAGERAAFKQSEANRATEQAQAQASFAAMDQRCEQRINTARDAAAAIGEIVNGNSSHPAAVGGRALVSADQLRRVVGQSGGASTGTRSVSGGSNGSARQ